jgi:hypothetical protein
MPIQPKPIIIPQKTLDKLWIQSLSISGGSPGSQSWFNATLVPYNDAGDCGEGIALDPIDVFASMAEDPTAAALMGAFMEYITGKAVLQGKIEAEDSEG